MTLEIQQIDLGSGYVTYGAKLTQNGVTAHIVNPFDDKLTGGVSVDDAEACRLRMIETTKRALAWLESGPIALRKTGGLHAART